MKESVAIFTPAEIGRCLNCTPQNVRKMLKNTPPDSENKIISGVPRPAWRFDCLPCPLIDKLAKAAVRHGFGTPLQFLQNSLRREEPLPSLAHISDDEITRAQKLQRALARALRSPNESPIAQLVCIAAQDYQREFGYSISDRQLRHLIDRTIKRDRGHGNFEKLEIYLPERPAKRSRRSSPLGCSFRFAELAAVFATLQDRTKPSLSEIAYCWREVIKLWSDRLTTGADEIKLKRQLREYLLGVAPFMGDSAVAIKRNLNRKIREALEHGIETIVDGRLNPGRVGRKPADFDAMIKLLAKHALFHCGRRKSQAYR